MRTVSIELDPETETRLRLRATSRGETLEVYLRHLAEREAESADPLGAGIAWLTNRTAADVEAARGRILAASPPARTPPPGTTVLGAVEGKWPGTETDAEIRQALDRVS